jgi:hypothetical protein
MSLLPTHTITLGDTATSRTADELSCVISSESEKSRASRKEISPSGRNDKQKETFVNDLSRSLFRVLFFCHLDRQGEISPLCDSTLKRSVGV